MVGKRILKRLGAAGERRGDAARHVLLSLELLDAGDRIAERDAAGQVEGDGDSRKLAELIDGERAGRALHPGKRPDGNELAGGIADAHVRQMAVVQFALSVNSMTTLNASPVL